MVMLMYMFDNIPCSKPGMCEQRVGVTWWSESAAGVRSLKRPRWCEVGADGRRKETAPVERGEEVSDQLERDRRALGQTRHGSERLGTGKGPVLELIAKRL
jgi:hypothetical protein